MTPIEVLVHKALKQYELDMGWVVHQQKKIDRYRVDFVVDNVVVDCSTPPFSVVIECDGHDFHERTKEQAEKDKRRDRVLQFYGYRVHRYTGSEIWRSSGECVLPDLGWYNGQD